MPESPRVQLVREAYEAYNAGDFESVLALLHDDVELLPPPSSLEPEPIRGVQAVREYMAPNLFDEQQAEPLEILEEGERVLAIVHARARGRGSGVEVDQTLFHLFTLSGDRASRFEIHIDRETALAALGQGSR